MKGTQYVIKNLRRGGFVGWNFKTILFDTQEEAEEMIESYPNFFGETKSLEIKKGIFFIDDSINYKNVKNSERFKKCISKL